MIDTVCTQYGLKFGCFSGQIHIGQLLSRILVVFHFRRIAFVNLPRNVGLIQLCAADALNDQNIFLRTCHANRVRTAQVILFDIQIISSGCSAFNFLLIGEIDAAVITQHCVRIGHTDPVGTFLLGCKCKEYVHVCLFDRHCGAAESNGIGIAKPFLSRFLCLCSGDTHRQRRLANRQNRACLLVVFLRTREYKSHRILSIRKFRADHAGAVRRLDCYRASIAEDLHRNTALSLAGIVHDLHGVSGFRFLFCVTVLGQHQCHLRCALFKGLVLDGTIGFGNCHSIGILGYCERDHSVVVGNRNLRSDHDGKALCRVAAFILHSNCVGFHLYDQRIQLDRCERMLFRQRQFRCCRRVAGRKCQHHGVGTGFQFRVGHTIFVGGPHMRFAIAIVHIHGHIGKRLAVFVGHGNRIVDLCHLLGFFRYGCIAHIEFALKGAAGILVALLVFLSNNPALDLIAGADFDGHHGGLVIAVFYDASLGIGFQVLHHIVEFRHFFGRFQTFKNQIACLGCGNLIVNTLIVARRNLRGKFLIQLGGIRIIDHTAGF